MNKMWKYWVFTLIGTLVAAYYPLYMGVCVLNEMITNGTVTSENYPKYIIPYTPISLAVILAVILMPFLIKYLKRFALFFASSLSITVFFLSEFLLESKVFVTTTTSETVKLEGWQMFMCYIPPDAYTTRTWKAVDILIGDYSPAFKIHFYLISVILIISILSCLYGFAQIIRSGNRTRLKALVVQSFCTVIFLGLCILACFTAFFRDGELTVSALSAMLMSMFFILLGVTSGIYVGSFLLGRKKYISILLPSMIASFITLMMYIGEMILLSGHLYQFGSGFLFESIKGIVLAPIDLLVILMAGVINGGICFLINKK